MSEESYVWGTGKRKCAIAQARLFPGKGEIVVNDRPYQEAFPRIEHRRMIEHPLQATNTMGKFRVTVKVNGGWASVVRLVPFAMVLPEPWLRKTNYSSPCCVKKVC
jgi:small subunit ribosomal protein S9